MPDPKKSLWVCVALALASGPGLVGQEQSLQKGGGDETGQYEVVANWPKPLPNHEGWVPGPIVAVFAESADRVFFVQRGEMPAPKGRGGAFLPIYGAPGRPAGDAYQPNAPLRREHFVNVADRNGNIVETWTQWDKHWEGSRGPHHIKINPYDPEKHVWIIDDDLQQVFEFTNDGNRLVMTLGERLVRGNDGSHFGRPTDIAFLPDGTFFVADGYQNQRVLKFDKNGKLLMTWGKEGSGPGEFRSPVHAIAIDNERRLYVADRGNSRLQVFDENGKHLDTWPNIRDPYHVHVGTDQSVWVVDGTTNKFLKFDRNGRLLSSWGTYGQFPGGLWAVHQFSVDSEGNLYTAEASNGRIQKFRARPGADPAQVIPPEPRLPRRVGS